MPGLLKFLQWGVVLAAAGATLAAAANRESRETTPAPNDKFASNRAMANLLRQIAEQTRNSPNDYSNEEQISRIRARLATPLSPQEQLQTRFQLAEELLKARRNDEAIRTFEAFIKDLKAAAPDVYAGGEAFFTTRIAIAYLRLAEQNNCIHHHNPDSCLFPISNKGVHSNREGSLRARAALASLLEKNPDYLPARWLYCVASMTLGEYPQNVPEAWRFPDDAFKSDYDIKRFPDIAAATGLGVTGLAGGVCMEDFNSDGLLDIVVSSWGVEDQLRLFINLGNGGFEERTKKAGLEGLVGGLNLIHADYNNDGHIDILVLRGAWLDGVGKHPNSLLRNNGDGTFTDTTEQSGLLSFRPTQTAAWFDYDGDGWLDLFIGNESNGGHAFPCELFLNNGDGSFTEVASTCRVNFSEYIKAAVAGDFNNDGSPEIYVANMFSKMGRRIIDQVGASDYPDGIYEQIQGSCIGNRLYTASGSTGEPFREIGPKLGVNQVGWAYAPTMTDLNGDGWLDLYATTGFISRDRAKPDG